MAAVDVAEERRVDVVPEQLLQPFGQPAHDVARTASTWFSTWRIHDTA